MLLLIAAYRHKIGIVKQYVRRHKRRIGKQARAYIAALLCALILKLRHAGKLAHIRYAGKHPAKLRVCAHLRLKIHNIFLRVQTAGNVQRQQLKASLAQKGRILSYRYRMQIHHAVIGIVFLLEFDKIPKRAQIVSYRKSAGRLNSAENCLFPAPCFHIFLLCKSTPKACLL